MDANKISPAPSDASLIAAMEENIKQKDRLITELVIETYMMAEILREIVNGEVRNMDTAKYLIDKYSLERFKPGD